MTLRGDGRLTGPGTVTFEAENRGGPKSSLAIIGIVFAREKQKNTPVILKSTPEQAVIPTEPSLFRLKISDEEWAEWTRQYDPLTVGITFAKPDEAQRWTYQNLLKPEDAAKQPPGEFKVKGAFKPGY